MGTRRPLTCMHRNGLLEIEYGLLPMGGWILRASTEVDTIVLYIESYVKVTHQSLCVCVCVCVHHVHYLGKK